MSDVGLARGTVRVVTYQPTWPATFAKEADALARLLALPLESVQHVGSTSVPGLCAKPIIDIAIRVESLEQTDKWSDVLKTGGYWSKGPESSMPERRFFAKGPEANRTIYLHVVTPAEFDRLILFRDTLRSNPDLVDQYAALKTRLAKRHVNDRSRYTHLKNDFIRSVLSRRR